MTSVAPPRVIRGQEDGVSHGDDECDDDEDSQQQQVALKLCGDDRSDDARDDYLGDDGVDLEQAGEAFRPIRTIVHCRWPP